MSVSRFSETLAYTPDLNKLRDEIISTLRFYEEKYSKIARLQAPRQPLTDEQIKQGILEADPAGEDLCRWSFAAGIVFAEKAHGIGGE